MKTTRALLLFLLLLSLAAAGCGEGSSSGSDDAADADTTEAVEGTDVPDAAAPDGADKDVPPVDAPDAVDVPADVPPDTTPLDPEVAALLDEGRYWLEHAEPYMALDAFELALALAPEQPDALYGAGLSEAVFGAERFLTFLQMIPGQMFGFPPPPEDAGAFWATENDWLADELVTILSHFRDNFVNAAARFDALGEAPGWVFEMSSVPVYAGVKPILRFAGDHGPVDRHLVQAVNHTLIWIASVITAQDWHTDVMTVIAMATDLDDFDVWGILGLINYLIEEDARFFAIDEDHGRQHADEAYASLRGVGAHLLAALELAREQQPGEGFVTAYDPDETSDTLIIRDRVVLGGWDVAEEEAFTLVIPTAFQELMQATLDAMETPGARHPWADGALVQIGGLLTGMGKSGLLDLFGIGELLPIDLAGLEMHQAHAVARSLLPAPLAVDWATFHADPVGLRDLLPRLAELEGADGASIPAMEWECGAEVEEHGQPQSAAGFLCSKGAALVDAPHFVGSAHEIPADGLTSRLPYLLWRDPTVGGLLSVDATQVDDALLPDGLEPGYAPATNWSLNLAVHQMLGKILDTFVD